MTPIIQISLKWTRTKDKLHEDQNTNVIKMGPEQRINYMKTKTQISLKWYQKKINYMKTKTQISLKWDQNKG